MMWRIILAKDAREHGLALCALTLGLLAVFALSLARQSASEFSMSSFQVVYFALLTIMPLIALILGNRLIVREYTGGTRRFMESLPIAPATPLVVKFVSGWLYLLIAGAMLIALAAWFADPAEYYDKRYLALLLSKTGTVLSLLWSIVFFASLTGKFRLIIYLAIITALVYLFFLPGFNENRLPPVALMDSELFALERDIFPWRHIGQTLLIAAAITLAGFGLALASDGSYADQLGKPLSRRNLLATSIMVIAILTIATSLREKWTPEPAEFTGRYVLQHDDPAIEVAYIADQHREQAQLTLNNLRNALLQMREDVGLRRLPMLKVTLNTGMEKRQISATFRGSVSVTANFADFNTYEHSMMNTVALHHIMLLLTNSRWDYESRHWLLDGFARWWAEGGASAPASPNTAEYLARAVLAMRQSKPGINPLLAWQRTTEQHGFESAFALGFTALMYLQQTHGAETLHKLASSYLFEDPPSSSVESLKTLFNTDTSRFQQITSLSIDTFTQSWLAWLEEQGDSPAVNALIDAAPALNGSVTTDADDNGTRFLSASYQSRDTQTDTVDGDCVLRYKRTLAYDREEDIFNKEHDRQPCTTTQTAHRIASPFAPGDRAFVILEHEAPGFNWPIRVWSGRVTIQ
jgi:ABC-type transport system involved in multi-copper enzyme maturation permease subunit